MEKAVKPGKPGKDQIFDILKSASNLQQDKSDYETIFEVSNNKFLL